MCRGDNHVISPRSKSQPNAERDWRGVNRGNLTFVPSITTSARTRRYIGCKKRRSKITMISDRATLCSPHPQPAPSFAGDFRTPALVRAATFVRSGADAPRGPKRSTRLYQRRFTLIWSRPRSPAAPSGQLHRSLLCVEPVMVQTRPLRLTQVGPASQKTNPHVRPDPVRQCFPLKRWCGQLVIRRIRLPAHP